MAKRTYEQSLTFFKHRTKTRGEGRELYKTPRPLIQKIVNQLLIDYPELNGPFAPIWVDPCAGDGRWEEEINKIDSNIRCISLDIEPCSDNVIKQDFLSLTCEDIFNLCKSKGYKLKPYEPFMNFFFIGNPPFSKVTQFVDKAINLKALNTCPGEHLLSECGFFLGGSALWTGRLADKAETIYRFEEAEGRQKDLRSKAVFEDTSGKDVLIWSCGGLFGSNPHYGKLKRMDTQTDGYFRVAVKCWCENNKRRVRKIWVGDLKNS